MDNIKTSLAMRIATLNQLKADGGPLDEPTLILWTSNVEPHENVTLADLTEATFTGYAAVTAITYGSPYVTTLGQVILPTPSKTFARTGGTISETVFGWAIVNAGKTVLHYAERLPQPVPLIGAGQGLTVDPSFTYGK